MSFRTLLPSFCAIRPRLLLLLFGPAARSAVLYITSAPLGFGYVSDIAFDAGAKAAMSINPLDSIAGAAAECRIADQPQRVLGMDLSGVRATCLAAGVDSRVGV